MGGRGGLTVHCLLSLLCRVGACEWRFWRAAWARRRSCALDLTCLLVLCRVGTNQLKNALPIGRTLTWLSNGRYDFAGH